MLYDEVKASFLGIDAIRAAAARIRDHGSGEIRIASLYAPGHSVVPKAVSIFQKKHPEARITLLVLPSRDVRDLIASGQFDVGLAADLIDTTRVVPQNFLARDALCALPIGHALASKEVITPMDLDGVSFISYLPEDRFRQRIDAVLARGI